MYERPWIILTLLSSLLYGLNVCDATKPNHTINVAQPSSTSTTNTNTDDDDTIKKTYNRVLVLDVDNTLYNEGEIKSKAGFGIEDQIIQRTHDFGKKYYNLSPDECNDMYYKYGSTVEGLRSMLDRDGKSKEEVKEAMLMYYNEVYDGIDMSCLISTRNNAAGGKDDQSNTGYSHEKSFKQRKILIETLKGIKEPIYLASNSPKSHVMKVVRTLGLGDINFAGVLTPDSVRDSSVTQDLPTKINPFAFFHPLIDRYDLSTDEIILIDDSMNNLKKANDIGIQGMRVNNGQSGKTLSEALGTFLGILDPNYRFSDVKYLQSKNEVDLVSINVDVWENLAMELSQLTRNSNMVRIVDLGAGLLSMLQLILHGGGGKQSLLHLMDNAKSINTIEYIAYESNKNLFDSCYKRLEGMGFVKVGKVEVDDENVFRANVDGIEVIVKLRVKNFSNDTMSNEQGKPHVVIGCCFADLFDPDELAASLIRFLQYCTVSGGVKSDNDPQSLQTLVYFPITFAGITQFLPPKPFGVTRNNWKKKIPSDTLTFQKYAQSLVDQHGHNLDPDRIIEAISGSHGKLLKSGSSVWNIDPQSNTYLWETMMYFFASSTGSTMSEWDFSGWIQRARNERPKISVTNKDLLFSVSPKQGKRLDAEKGGSNECAAGHHQSENVEEIMFQAPYNVTTVTKVQGELKPGQIEVKSICSLISSGTELKIFKGMFEDAALDVNIKGMADETMKYPLSYGYSLVGTVTRCAPDVPDAENIIGRTVFTFSPHSTHAIVDLESIQFVPDGISPEDAIFMPSVETALSIVHDTNMRIGENVAVFGQGLIGLLVNAILSTTTKNYHFEGKFNTVTAIDTLSDRMAMAAKMGSAQVLLPNEVHNAAPFDVAIEVSGNARALQAAIDNTRDGGRIIVGSWYGNSDIKLKLGIDFHRSHKTIKTSQVSTIPAELASLWSKSRRFALTWDLVKMLKPSKLITKKVRLNEAQLAYELLDQGKEIAISFLYS